MKRRIVALLPLGIVCLIAHSADADATAKSANVTVNLVSEVTAIQPGKPFTVALRMQMAPSWHTYWRNPGDSGKATRVIWTLPDNFRAGDLQWPMPTRSVDGGLALYGYENEAVFLVEITPSPTLPAGKFTVAAQVNWLECHEICIPGRANVDLALPSTSSHAPAMINGATEPLFTAARAAIPAHSTTLKIRQSQEGDQIVLKISGGRLDAPLEFFPETSGVMDTAAHIATKVGATWEIRAKRATQSAPSSDQLKGVLVSGSASARRAFAVIAGAPAAPPARP